MHYYASGDVLDLGRVAIGGEVNIRTLDGEFIKITISPGRRIDRGDDHVTDLVSGVELTLIHSILSGSDRVKQLLKLIKEPVRIERQLVIDGDARILSMKSSYGGLTLRISEMIVKASDLDRRARVSAMAH